MKERKSVCSNVKQSGNSVGGRISAGHVTRQTELQHDARAGGRSNAGDKPAIGAAAGKYCANAANVGTE